MITDFQTSFNGRIINQFSGKTINIPPHRKLAATLPCEIFVLKKSPCPEPSKANSDSRFMQPFKANVVVHSCLSSERVIFDWVCQFLVNNFSGLFKLARRKSRLNTSLRATTLPATGVPTRTTSLTQCLHDATVGATVGAISRVDWCEMRTLQEPNLVCVGMSDSIQIYLIVPGKWAYICFQHGGTCRLEFWKVA